MTYEEFLMRRDRCAEDTEWMELFKAGIRKQSGDAEEFYLSGKLVATCYVDGKFKRKQFEEENPHVVEQYSRRPTRKEFDVEWFKKENPEMFEQYRATSFRVK